MTRPEFVNGEFYHIYNHGVDNRDITVNQYDLDRLIRSLILFNTEKPIGSIFEVSFSDSLYLETLKKLEREPRLVNIICYCVNPNHFHLLLEQTQEGGIPEFIKRFAGGYTLYFNKKHGRRGPLFEGRYKALHVPDNDYLLHLSVYINLNFKVHKLRGQKANLVVSSWDEYIGTEVDSLICKPDIILDQFESRSQYKKYALETLSQILETKMINKELHAIFDMKK